GERGEAAHVGEEDADVHLDAAHRRFLEAPAAQARVLARRREAETIHDAPAEAAIRDAADGAARVARKLSHQTGEPAPPVRLEGPEEHPIASFAHGQSMA